MKPWLIPVALWLGTVGVGGMELTEIQSKALQVALEEFHNYPAVQWAFRETGVDSAEDTPFSAGTYVTLEFKLQQTLCRKRDWKKPECKVKPKGRVRKCLACIKLDPQDKVLGRMVHCPVLKEGPQELHTSQCSRVAQAGEGAHSFHLPGQFAFSKALRPT